MWIVHADEVKKSFAVLDLSMSVAFKSAKRISGMNPTRQERNSQRGRHQGEERLTASSLCIPPTLPLVFHELVTLRFDLLALSGKV